ncbi:Putative signal transduction histidine kinase (GAF sensor domain) [Methanocella conradii HZ254]|uniref:Signal transduction histidine kinase (GAF sensor domain) n=1 Tax=Methanocella conradii (strain DSM 24694 / JCM 17849 / CGMCC 1.5162 / HZ254) TaxID=1041930 RepID=H8I4R4_METCZ|nr:ATP-binding protein [Methanocella conradii]AFD00659.1 Putative signal transduction histidine kinase (GAF sensor domain) [Methanocella conradii HZ254]
MELMPADGNCIVAQDDTIVWCDKTFSEWFSHRGIGPGAKLSQLFPGARDLFRPGAIFEDADRLGKKRYFSLECKPITGLNGEKVSRNVRIRMVTLQRVLIEISRLSTQAKSPKELFEKVLWLMRETTHYLAFAGYVARDGRVELVSSKGWTEKLKSYVSLQDIAPDSMSLAGRTAYHRQQIVMAMKDYALSPAVKSAINKLGGEYIVVTPLVDQDRLVGVLTVINDKALTPLDSEALQSICGQVAVSLSVKLQEEAAAARADDAVLYANLIERAMKDKALSKEWEEAASGLVRSLNDNAALRSVALKEAFSSAASAAAQIASASGKKLNVKATGLDLLEVSPLFMFAAYEVLKNSVQHSTSSLVEADVRVSRDRSGTCRIEISDNGPGIPDEFKGEVFRQYKEIMKECKGIGLYLVKKIVNKYGGRVWIEDRVHGDHRKGAKVVIMIPPKA